MKNNAALGVVRKKKGTGYRPAETLPCMLTFSKSAVTMEVKPRRTLKLLISDFIILIITELFFVSEIPK